MGLLNRIEELEKELLELKELVKEEQEFPQDGDKYWYMTTTGKIFTSNWDGVDFNFDEDVLEIGNVFKTREQAEFAVEKLKVEAELRKFSRPFESGETSYYIFFHIEIDCLDTHFTSYCPPQGSIYFESEEKAQQAIKSVGEERVKKYIFGVEE